jgi:amidase
MGSVNQGLPWEKRVAAKRQACADKIPAAWRIPDNYLDNFQTPLVENKNNLIEAQAVRKSGILTEQELRITEDYTIAELLSALADGTLTSAEVTLAYSKRAAVAQQLVSTHQAHLIFLLSV